jgi:hypothetical protein
MFALLVLDSPSGVYYTGWVDEGCKGSSSFSGSNGAYCTYCFICARHWMLLPCTGA